MLNARNIYVVLMWIAGVALGLAIVARPELASAALPPLGMLLLISLIIDVTGMAIAASRGQQPIAMNTRLLGFFGAAILYLLITNVAGVPPGK